MIDDESGLEVPEQRKDIFSRSAQAWEKPFSKQQREFLIKSLRPAEITQKSENPSVTDAQYFRSYFHGQEACKIRRLLKEKKIKQNKTKNTRNNDYILTRSV